MARTIRHLQLFNESKVDPELRHVFELDNGDRVEVYRCHIDDIPNFKKRKISFHNIHVMDDMDLIDFVDTFPESTPNKEYLEKWDVAAIRKKVTKKKPKRASRKK